MSQSTESRLPVSALTAAILGVLTLVIAPTIFFLYNDTFDGNFEKVPKLLNGIVYSSFFLGVIGGTSALPYLITPNRTKVERRLAILAIATSVIGCAAMVSVFQQ